MLVRNGTLRVGDDFICGLFSGRVRALFDERGKIIKSAGPAIPTQVLGIEGVPMAGDQLLVVEDATAARDVAQRRQRLDREAKSRRTSRGGVSLEDFMAQSAAGEQSRLGPWACRDNTHVALLARNLAARGLHWFRLFMQKKRLVAVTRLS